MNTNEQLISQILDNVGAGLYTDIDDAILDLMALGLSIEDAAQNAFIMSNGHAVGGTVLVPAPGTFVTILEPGDCPVTPQGTQSCQERISQLVHLGYL